MSDQQSSRTNPSGRQGPASGDAAPSSDSADAHAALSKERAWEPHDGPGGIVPDRAYPPPSDGIRADATPGGLPAASPAAVPASTPHAVKFSGPGDAANAHADADHGSILVTAQVRVIFWGREWVSFSPPVSMATVLSDVKSILSGPYLDGLAQYDVNSAFVSQVHELTDEDPPNPFGRGDAADRVNRLIDDGVFPEPGSDNPPAVYAVFLPSAIAGTALKLPPGITGLHTRLRRFEWSELGFEYTSVAWTGNTGSRGEISFIFSHELAETMTDPDGSGWQVEPRDDSNWNEVCDVCQSSLLLNGVRVAAYWSNQDNSCIVTDSAFTIYKVEWIYRPNHIEWLGGHDQNGNPWQLSRADTMTRIRKGDQFKVDGGVSGRESTVGIYYLDAHHPYLATNTDGVPDDNLLALPHRPPA